MPFPNEHAFRVVSPGRFQANSFRRYSIGSGVSIIVGKLVNSNTMTTQSYRLDKDVFSWEDAVKWIESNNIKPIKSEKAVEAGMDKKMKAGCKDIQSFENEVIIFSNKIQSFKQEEIISLIPKDTLDEIMAKDPHPFFQIYSLCHEGVSTPTILGEEAEPITWTRKAIQSIKNIVTKGVKLFYRHNKDNSVQDRKEIGEVVHSFEKEINGKLHHVYISYHTQSQKEIAANLDINSQEAKWTFFREGGKLIAESITKLTGIALGNSRIEKPAFSGAKRLGLVQAFEGSNIQQDKKGDFMSDQMQGGDPNNLANVINSQLNKVNGQLSFHQWFGMKEQFNVHPHQFFKLDELKSDKEFGQYFDELDRVRLENEKLKKDLQDVKSTSETELKTLRKQIHMGTAKDRLSTLAKEQGITENMMEFINKSYDKSVEKIDDLTDDGLRSFIKDQTEMYQQVVSVIGQPETPPQTPTKNQPDEEPIDDTNVNLAENNEFLDEDFEEGIDVTESDIDMEE